MKLISLFQIVVSVLLVVTILLQNRGAGLGSAFGGDFGGYHTKRGMEKFIFRFSVFLAALFIVLAIASFIIANKA